MFKKKSLPEVYSEQELDILEEHISKHFGKYNNVIHEIVSPDIHVDICIIEPTKERNYYTLLTMGMGAHRMNVPKELRKEKLDRAEIVASDDETETMLDGFLSDNYEMPDYAYY